ncbi:MAG: hypothetical protein F6J93_38915 [Oscillatoria sp. SIO1A7]|nr:hypothetical protein [Oscillatoria sp. SIO1A7]
MDLTKLSFKAQTALLAAIAWALHHDSHLVEAMADLQLMLLVKKLIGRESCDSLEAPIYGEREKLASLAAAIANSLVQRFSELDENI